MFFHRISCFLMKKRKKRKQKTTTGNVVYADAMGRLFAALWWALSFTDGMKAVLFSSSFSSSSSSGGSQADLDRVYMERALELAAQAAGKTTPNPCVGCVLVKNGVIVGEGWHEKVGEPHAEVHALLRAGDRCAGATAYVSLEPCNHFGRTPPCTHALLRHGVARVVAGMVDPDPRVSGGGLAYLRGKGVAAEIIADRAMNRACKSLNAPFVHRIMFKRAHAVVWAALDAAHGALADPFATDVDMEGVHRVVPEANVVVLGEERFLRLDPRDVVKWPAHLAVAVDLGEAGGGGSGGGGGGAVAAVRAHVLRIVGVAQATGDITKARRWLLLRASGSDGGSADDGGEGDKRAGIEHHSYASHPAHRGDGVGDATTWAAVLGKVAELGYDCALLSAMSQQEVADLRKRGALQKLVLTEASAGAASAERFQEHARLLLAACGLPREVQPVCVTGAGVVARLAESTYEDHDGGFRVMVVCAWMQE